MSVNFVKALRAFHQFSQRKAMTANQVNMFEGIFWVMNDREWPEGMQEISNNELLAHTTFYGSHRDDTLREVRQQLAELGLITFTPGERRAKQPAYAINWEALGITAADAAPEIDPDFGPDQRGKNRGKPDIINNNSVERDINKNAKERGRAPRRALPNMEDVRAYCREIGLDVNPLKFLDYCATRGYRDWRAALRIWKFREEEERRRRGGYSTQRSYTEAELEARAGEL